MKARLKYFLIYFFIGIVLEIINYFIPTAFIVIIGIALLVYLFLLLSKKIWDIIKNKYGEDDLMILIKPIFIMILSGIITKNIIIFLVKK